MTLISKILAVLLFAFVLAGCGQSGPLYVPGEPESVQPQSQQPESTEDAEDENEDSTSQ